MAVKLKAHLRAWFSVLGLSVLGQSFALAASSFIDPAYIVQVSHDLETTRGPSGRAWIMLDRHFALAGTCAYYGGVDNQSGWMIEFDVEKSSFSAMYALALSAYLSGKAVHVDYDDGFGGGTTCRIINIASE